MKALQARIAERATGEVPDGVYANTAFMNYVKPVVGAKKFDANALTSVSGSSRS